ncbi:MAG TPA: ArsR family transcriptional regulator [Anaerolineae bacterium]|nr:ArsR family transcriptional regulator [Anaerolineae bacterium]
MARALAHPTRIAILEILRRGEVCVCEMDPGFETSQSSISQHLAVLRDSNLVAARRDGTRMMYGVTDERVFQVLDLMGSIAHDQLNAARQALAALEGVAA